ncbi:MAG: glycosyltransferase family 2 protein [bacterium]
MISIVIPVFNEKNTILKILEKIQKINLEKEIIIVDDGSTDGTKEILQNIKENNIKILYHSKNQGKGAALKTGFNEVKGDIIIIQDADLEYDPENYFILIKPIKEGYADAVYGSRFLGIHRVFLIWHYLGNKFLTGITNILYNTTLSDMETGAKVFKTEIIKNITIKSKKFDIEPEITAKILKQNIRLYEVPISYYGRDYKEGKKITWKDGIKAIYVLIKYRFFD